MSIIATNYPDPQNPGTPIPAACAWVFGTAENFGLGSMFANIWVHRSAAAAAVVPLVDPADKFTVSSGDALTDGTKFKTILELKAAAAALVAATPGLDPYSAIRTVLYTDLAKHPRFVGTNPVKG